MYKLHMEREIAVSHFLPEHEGKCRNIHGHNLKVVVDVYSDRLYTSGSQFGMVVDFGQIKRVIDSLDHKHLNDECYFTPTAEHLSEFFAQEIVDLVAPGAKGKVVVQVHEATNQYAEYTLEY